MHFFFKWKNLNLSRNKRKIVHKNRPYSTALSKNIAINSFSSFQNLYAYLKSVKLWNSRTWADNSECRVDEGQSLNRQKGNQATKWNTPTRTMAEVIWDMYRGWDIRLSRCLVATTKFHVIRFLLEIWSWTTASATFWFWNVKRKCIIINQITSSFPFRKFSLHMPNNLEII